MSSNLSSEPPARRSRRSRKVSAKYVNDGWNKETLRLLRESSESSNPTSVDTDQQPEETDEEFDEPAIQPPSDVVDDVDNDNLSMISGSSKTSSIAASGAGEEAEDDEGSIAEIGRDGRSVRKRIAKPPSGFHSRGVTSAERGKSARAGVWQITFGPEVEDLKPMAFAKDLWLYNTRDVTLPSFKTCQEAKKSRLKRNTHSHEMPDQTSHDPIDASAQTESQVQFLRSSDHQSLKRLSLDEARSRLFIVDGKDHKLVMGPWSQQQQYDLPYLSPINIGQAWRRRGDPSGSSHHSGWSLNVGEKPLHMVWSSYTGQAQYLAITCRSTPQQRESVSQVTSNKTPAFSPSASYPNSIQIWKFATNINQRAGPTMELEKQPQLVTILGCMYGDVKQMSWKSGIIQGKADGSSGLETLALVTSDGCFRLIHVPEPDSDSTIPTCIEVEAPALLIEPPTDTIFTCFTFATTGDIIIGTSSGHIHIYNILQAQGKNGVVEPYFSLQLHQTYIMSLCTVPDEEYSHFLASASAAGTILLTDLRSPIQDTITMARARIPTRNLICNAQTRAFITTIDSSGNTEPRGNAQTSLVAHNLRHFYTAMVLSKFPEGSGTATALVGSSLHPSVMMGNTSGSVWAQNVLRRIVPTGKPGAKNDGGAWIQKIVEYDWIPQPSEHSAQQPIPTTSSNPDTENKTTFDLHHGQPVRPGISRFHHGFRPERLDLSNAGSRKRKTSASGPNGESAIQVIFEDEQAVTALIWNENPIASTWCAIGWGSGVVLITELGHDAK